jgi:lipopolysaccharide biosynthesis regulator YciM
MLCLASAIQRERGSPAAIAALTDHLARHVDLAALERLLAMQAEEAAAAGGPSEHDRVVHQVVHYLLARQSPYHCVHCGFQARALHWQCPSCKRWGSVQPLQAECIPGDEVLQDPRLA